MNRELRNRILGGAGFVFGLALLPSGIYTLFVLGVPSTLGFLILGVMLLYWCWQPMMPTRYPPIQISVDEPEMQLATERAQASIERFCEGIARSDRKGAVRIAVETKFGSQQRIWANVQRQEGNLLLLKPRSVNPNVSTPESVPVDQVEDWLLADLSGRIEGGFTHVAYAEKYQRQEGYIPRGLRLELSKFVDGNALLNP
ncbi:uncharacterized protein YegJ (DUF2314 family) [Litorivivens lipolytica]|uniref:Uncharacterized protein YegJ (DUF2314 family) n=1 Tax=Litorivivens lipolytica TaxID=1524264 RepID=A0A7W4W3B1_9GAMM|nr:DUF2314 domain-containing protein [Litorivivens lipolytica]MBB3046122.1 uncharacterized protein YegJ (DUF2314 family) [Litorivivens lipolytica]